MKIMMEELPERVFDVGIAEQHAVTFAAGLALGGKRPFCNIYSSFAQRAYDQVIHDVALQDIPVVFCFDRAGLVGEDGPTHHGVFDLAFLRSIPGVIVLAPMDEWEMRNMMYWSLDYLEGPVFIRYPRGRGVKGDLKNKIGGFRPGRSRLLCEGNSVAVLSVGTLGNAVQEAIMEPKLKGRVEHWDIVSVKPLDTAAIQSVLKRFKTVLTIEEGVIKGGVGEAIKAMALDFGYRGSIINLGLPDQFAEHGSRTELLSLYGLDAGAIREHLLRSL
jgi:1-deoxy-D-xylulose-5-phosphate synthase